MRYEEVKNVEKRVRGPEVEEGNVGVGVAN